MASANTSAADPAEAARQAAEAPDEHDDRRRHAEVDEVGEAVELGAEAGLRLERAREAAVDAVEQGGDDDQRDGQLVALLDRHADGGEAGAQAEQREEVRHQHAHGDLAVAEQQPRRRRRRSSSSSLGQQGSMRPLLAFAARQCRPELTARAPRAPAPPISGRRARSRRRSRAGRPRPERACPGGR